jgi:2-phospho-L-lactate guanylyltransferase
MAREPKSWAVVVPVKRLAVAKTRLALDPRLRSELALAMAVDVVAACVAAESVTSVLVVTDDEAAAPAVTAVGADVVADLPDAGLNPALGYGAQILAAAHPEAGVAAVSSDLPALTPAVLDAVLRRAAAVDVACVADAAGTGTTLLAARRSDAFTPSFGEGSLRRHLDAGAVDLTATADARLRRDVDTIDDLSVAVDLGCGTETMRLLDAHPDWKREVLRG